MESISLQLEHENWAYKHGYINEVQIILVADFLNGFSVTDNRMDSSLAILPNGLCIEDTIRQIFYNAGRKLSKIKHTIEDADILQNLRDLFNNFHSTIMSVLKENSILTSTGDCRGACEYNTGDRTEYLNYGW